MWPCLNNAGCFLRNGIKKAFLEWNNGAAPAGSVQRSRAGGVLWALLLEAMILKDFSTLSYESGISPRAGLVGVLSVSGAGCSIHRSAWCGGGRCSSYPAKNTSTGKAWRKAAGKKKKAGIGVTDAVVTQRVNPKVSQVSHTSGTESVLARVVSLWEMLNP